MNKEEKGLKGILKKIGKISNKNLNLIIKILCVLAAVSIWFYFDSLENPKITANIENIVVELRNEDSVALPDYNYEIFTGRNQRINIAVKGTEANIEKVKNNIVAYVDMREARFDENTLSRLMNIYIDKKSIPAGIEIVSQSESVMIVAIDKVIEKTIEDVNVTPDLGGQMLPDGYSIGDDIVVKYNGEIIRNITVRGPEQIINKIKTVEVIVDCKDRIRSFTASGSILLMDEYNNPLGDEDTKYIEVTPKSVIVEVPIIREQNVRLEVKGNRTGENIYKYADIQIIPSEVTVYGDTLVMDKEDLVLPIEIDETLITQRNGLFSSKNILETSGGITIKDDYQVTVDVQVNFQKVKDAYYWLSADAFQPINIHTDIQYFQILDGGIQIRIRGAEAIVDQLTDSGAEERHGGDIIAYADMSGFDGTTTGVQKVPLIFEFDISNLQDAELTEEEQQIYVFEIGPEPYYINVAFGYDDLNEDTQNHESDN
ncbi:MAG: hypothetical protein IJ325_12090 [Clostridia bacterium]|nr:hypothetical protein [Clostridia bacterium]